MVHVYDFKTKRTIVLKDTDRVQREALLRAGWVLRDPPAEPTAPTEAPPEKETPPHPVLGDPESSTQSPTHMGGIFEVSAKDQGGSPFVEVAAEKGQGQNFLGENLGDAQNFGGSNLGEEPGPVVEITAGDKADLKDLETNPPAAVEILPEPVEVKKKAGARGRPVGSGKKPAHTWEGNLPE